MSMNLLHLGKVTSRISLSSHTHWKKVTTPLFANTCSWYSSQTNERQHQNNKSPYRDYPYWYKRLWPFAIIVPLLGYYALEYIDSDTDPHNISLRGSLTQSPRIVIYNWDKRPKRPYLDEEIITDVPSVAKSQLSREPLEEIPYTKSSVAEPVEQTPVAEPIKVEEPAAPPPTKVVEPEATAAVALPVYVPYLIVGGGPGGMAAAQAIRASDPSAQVLIISAEDKPPYLRPALSKEAWRRSDKRQESLLSEDGDMRQHSWVFYEPKSFFLTPEQLASCEYGGVALLGNTTVIRIDPDQRLVELSDGRKLSYGQCLLSTGGRPKQLPSLHECTTTHTDLYAEGRISYFRTIEDYKKLRALTEKGGKILVIGGGFLGSELSSSLAEIAAKRPNSQLSVINIFKESGPLVHVLPPHLSEHTRQFLIKKGVQVKDHVQATECFLTPSKTLSVVLTDIDDPKKQTTLEDIDHIVIAVGLVPNTDLANTTTGLEVDSNNGGFLVNSEMEAAKGVYVAGDVSSFYDPLLGRRRVEHQNHAEESGRIAGRNMAASLCMERAFEEKRGACQYHQVPKLIPDVPGDSSRNLSVLSRAYYQYQSSIWSYLSPELSWDAVGLCDAEKLTTHTFMAGDSSNSKSSPNERGEQSFDRAGVVFYTKPGTGRIMGILLWNLPEDLYSDVKRYAPSRLNLARKILADRRSYSPTELANLAKEFDLHGSIDLIYQRMKARTEKEESTDSKENSTSH